MVAAAGHHARIVGGLDTAPGETRGPVDVALRPAGDDEQPRVDLVGIGVVLAARGDALSVVEVLDGSGAAEAGLAPGDLVLAVDGTPATELGYAGAVQAIRGPEGTTVLLTVRRGDRTFDVRAPRRMVRG